MTLFTFRGKRVQRKHNSKAIRKSRKSKEINSKQNKSNTGGKNVIPISVTYGPTLPNITEVTGIIRARIKQYQP